MTRHFSPVAPGGSDSYAARMKCNRPAVLSVALAFAFTALAGCESEKNDKAPGQAPPPRPAPSAEKVSPESKPAAIAKAAPVAPKVEPKPAPKVEAKAPTPVAPKALPPTQPAPAKPTIAQKAPTAPAEPAPVVPDPASPTPVAAVAPTANVPAPAKQPADKPLLRLVHSVNLQGELEPCG